MNWLSQRFFPTNFEFSLKVPEEISARYLSQSFDSSFSIISQAGRWQQEDALCHVCVIVM